ncbi:MAG: DUF190 domain-containing protein [Mycobacteriaceae bacterium]
MHLERRALRLTIFVGETDTYHHRPLYHKIVWRARRAGLAGASVFHGIEGFGPSHRIHGAHVLHLREERPIAIIIVDAADRIHAFISQINQLITRGLLVTDPVDVVLYTDQPDSELLHR